MVQTAAGVGDCSTSAGQAGAPAAGRRRRRQQLPFTGDTSIPRAAASSPCCSATPLQIGCIILLPYHLSVSGTWLLALHFQAALRCGTMPLLRGRPCTRAAPRSCHITLLARRRRRMGGAGTAPGGAAGREGWAPQRLCGGRPAEAAGQGDDGEGARAGGGAARFPSDTAHRGRPLSGRPDGLAHWGSCCIMAESALQQCATRVVAEFLCPFSLEVGPLAIAHVRGCSERS